jgi:hypothetical protein
MLHIQNIRLIQSKFAGTPEWKVGEVFVSPGSYVFLIDKREGSWKLGPEYFNQLTILLSRGIEVGNDGYSMKTGFIRLSMEFKSICAFDEIKSMATFIKCLDNHIQNILNDN